MNNLNDILFVKNGVQAYRLMKYITEYDYPENIRFTDFLIDNGMVIFGIKINDEIFTIYLVSNNHENSLICFQYTTLPFFKNATPNNFVKLLKWLQRNRKLSSRVKK